MAQGMLAVPCDLNQSGSSTGSEVERQPLHRGGRSFGAGMLLGFMVGSQFSLPGRGSSMSNGNSNASGQEHVQSPTDVLKQMMPADAHLNSPATEGPQSPRGSASERESPGPLVALMESTCASRGGRGGRVGGRAHERNVQYVHALMQRIRAGSYRYSDSEDEMLDIDPASANGVRGHPFAPKRGRRMRLTPAGGVTGKRRHRGVNSPRNGMLRSMSNQDLEGTFAVNRSVTAPVSWRDGSPLLQARNGMEGLGGMLAHPPAAPLLAGPSQVGALSLSEFHLQAAGENLMPSSPAATGRSEVDLFRDEQDSQEKAWLNSSWVSTLLRDLEDQMEVGETPAPGEGVDLQVVGASLLSGTQEGEAGRGVMHMEGTHRLTEIMDRYMPEGMGEGEDDTFLQRSFTTRW